MLSIEELKNIAKKHCYSLEPTHINNDLGDRLPALKDGASFFVGVSRSLCDMVAIAPGESIPLQCYVAVCAKP